MKTGPFLFLFAVIYFWSATAASATRPPEEIYNLDDILGLQVTPGGIDSIRFRRLDGMKDSCPVTLAIEIEGEVEANGDTVGYFDEVSIQAGQTTAIAFAGDSGPGFDENGNPAPFNGVTKTARIQVTITVGEAITLRYETRNSLWNDGWGAKVSSVEVVPQNCAGGRCPVNGSSGSAGGGSLTTGQPGGTLGLGGSSDNQPSFGGIIVDYNTDPSLIGLPDSLRLASAAFNRTDAERALAENEIPRMLVINDNGDLWQTGETLRQIITENNFVDIVADSTGNAYEIRYYRREDLDSRDSSGYFTLQPGAIAERIWRIEATIDSSTSEVEKVTFIETSGGLTRVTEYIAEGGDDWTVVRGTGADRVIERKEVTVDGNATTETLRIYGIDSSDNEVLVHVESETRTTFAFGTVVTERTQGEGTAQRITTFEYWPDSASESRAGRLKKIAHPSGRWEYFHDYDANGRVAQKVEQYLSNPYTGNWPDSANRMIETLRSGGDSGFRETFASSPGSFTTFKVASSGNDWQHKSTDGGYMEANGFGASGASETWLLAPAQDLSGTVSPILRFESSKGFSGPNLQVRVSTDYTGGDPTASGVTWTTLSAALSSGNRVWQASGAVDLSGHAAANTTIAFVYTSNGGSAGQAAEWRVRNVEVNSDAASAQERKVWLAGDLVERSWEETIAPFDARTGFGPTLPDTIRRTSVATDVTANDPLAASNRITTRYYYPKDASAPGLPNRLRKVEHPNGEIELHTYESTTSGGLIHRQWRGTPNGSGDTVVHGFFIERETDSAGREISRERSYIASGGSPLLIEFHQAVDFDTQGRATEIVYGDGTTVTRQYGCCGLQSETGRDGLTTLYQRDEHGRAFRTETWSGSTFLGAIEERFDARGRVVRRTRIGEDDTAEIVERQMSYHTNGELAWERDALDRLITHSTDHGVSGFTERRQSLPDNALDGIISRYHPDGSIYEEVGPLVNDTRHTYSIESDPDHAGNHLIVRTRTLLDANGDPTTEFVSTLSRPAGLLRLTRRPSGTGSGTAEARTEMDLAGRTTASSDFDGVITRFTYPDPFTTLEYLDADQSGSLTAGDSARRTTRTWVADRGTVLERQTTEEWDDTDTFVTVRQTDRETIDANTNGLETWTADHGAETYTLRTHPAANATYTVTTTFADDTGSQTYYTDGRTAWTRRLDTSGNYLRTVEQTYDNFGRVGSVMDSIDGTTSFLYDDLGRLTSQTLPDPDPADSATTTQTTNFTYTLLASGNERQTTTHPGNLETITETDPQGRTALRYGHGTYPEAWTYDFAGRRHTLTTWQDFDPATGTGLSGETVTRWQYNSAGLLQQKHYNDGGASSQPGPLHTYTPGGRPATKTLPRNGDDNQPIVITYLYADGTAGQPHTMRLTGIDYGSNTPETANVTYTHDNRGRVRTIEDGSGRRRLTYQAGRIISDLYETGPLAGYGHTQALDPQNGYRPSARSALKPNNRTLQRETLAYDDFGRIEALTVGQDIIEYGFHHDTSQPTTTTVFRDEEASITQTHVFDHLGRLKSISASDGTNDLFSAVQQIDALNRVTRITLADDHYWDYEYDSMNQVTSGVKRDPAGTALPGYSFGYGFDTIGNRENATRESTTENYTPNALNQIESIDHVGLLHLLGSADAAATLTLNGHPTTRTGERFYHALSGNNTFEPITLTGTLTGAGHNGTDAVAMIEGETYIPAGPTARTHDESGNLVEDARWLYTWDAENRLVRMETRPALVTAGAPHRRLNFEYDSQSRRTRKTVETWNGTEWQTDEDIRFLWNDWLLTAELRGNTLEPIRTYTWSHDISGSRDMTGGVGGLARIRHHQTNEVTIPLYGPNGNVWSYWNIDQAALTTTFQYGPFGELIAASGPDQDRHRFRFSTKYEDPATGYLYYGFRFYDSETGRWLNRDPIQEEGGLNVYGFVGNNSVNAWDFIGLLSSLAPWTLEKCDRLEKFYHFLERNNHEMIRGFDDFRELINYVTNIAYTQIATGFITGVASAVYSISIAPARAASRAADSYVPGSEPHRVVLEGTRNLERNMGAIREIRSGGSVTLLSALLYRLNTPRWHENLLAEIDRMSENHADLLRKMQQSQREAITILREECCREIK